MRQIGRLGVRSATSRADPLWTRRPTRDLPERLHQPCVIMLPTGDHGNVLEAGRLAVVSAAEGGFLAAMVDRTLTELR